MESIDFDNLTDEQKQKIFNLGLIMTVQASLDGVPPPKRVRESISMLKEKVGLAEETVWDTYEFLFNASLTVSKTKNKKPIGF